MRHFLSLALCAGYIFGQPALPKFDVASIKPSAPGKDRGIVRMMPGNQTYLSDNMTLAIIMTVAFSVTDRQIAGGPDWLRTDRWDINAKSESRHTAEEMHDMLARLLEDRFQLKIRRKKREMPVWALVLDKTGPKLTEHDPADLDHPPIGPAPDGRGMKATNVRMDYFALTLSRLLDRNVIDRTGLSKYYDFTFFFQRELPPRPEGGAPGEAAQPQGPSIFTALKEQLGLRLEPARGPVEFLVIEHAERPTAN